MQRVQRLIKQSKQKDYYKVLSVDRDADARTIKKALYVRLPSSNFIIHLVLVLTCSSHSRRAAKTAHPDKGGSEAKMAAVNEAYEVLKNPGKNSSYLPLSYHPRTHLPSL